MLGFLLRHRSRKMCKSHFPWWPVIWQDPSHLGQRRTMDRCLNSILFSPLDLSHAFKGFQAHYLALFLMYARVALRKWLGQWERRLQSLSENNGPHSLLLCREATDRQESLQPSGHPPTPAPGSALAGVWTQPKPAEWASAETRPCWGRHVHLKHFDVLATKSSWMNMEST